MRHRMGPPDKPGDDRVLGSNSLEIPALRAVRLAGVGLHISNPHLSRKRVSAVRDLADHDHKGPGAAPSRAWPGFHTDKHQHPRAGSARGCRKVRGAREQSGPLLGSFMFWKPDKAPAHRDVLTVLAP